MTESSFGLTLNVILKHDAEEKKKAVPNLRNGLICI